MHRSQAAPIARAGCPPALSPDEAVRLVAIEGTDALSLRDRALFELAYSSGLRLAELAGLDLDRVDLDHGEVRVWGKGAKERIVPVGAAARDAIRAWLPARTALRAARREGALSRRAAARGSRRAPSSAGSRNGR